ncbi:E3 ubiquitin-protein ligase MBR1-like isoform X2 [Phalaenopsis equestris]|uniref:E3 ubiquitin-protein ligase MBR1-like isoform X2 n=1 Tax=Phalaenopsis equestris TaxID=78828 RepID=UPI0009E37B70|nr:E3 ubiquitin-protein ligase MBR1-like isoform X2 [Phalaenopsis equestris]
MERPPFTILGFLQIKIGIETMAQRNIFYASPLPEFQNVHLSNPPNVNPQRHIERTMLGSNELTIMNYNVNSSHPNTANSNAICDNYQHPIFTISSNQNMTYQTQIVPYCYNHNANQTGVTMFYPPAANSRIAFKRKTPAHPVYQNPYGYLSTGTSSNFPVPPNSFQLKHMPFCSSPLHPNSNVYRYQDETLLSVGEEFQRNVRIRHNNAPQAELNPAWQPSSSRPTQLLHSSSSILAATVVGGPLNRNSLPGTYSQRNHTTNPGWNRPVSSNGVFGSDTEQNSAWNSDNSRNSHSRLPNPQGSDAQATWGCPTSYDRRLVLNRTSSNYTNLAATQSYGPSGNGFVSSSRIPRSINLQNSSTNRVLRNVNAGWPTFIPGNAQRGWTSQGFSMTDISRSAYALDLTDEHRDMRLDIDNMSYEELLVLEETIGNVSTGLSEDYLTKCLTERLYCSSASAQDDKDEEACCPICLEEFKDNDSQGLMKCPHVYHFTCIKKWLKLKKTCPVCKAPALDDEKQKQTVSS